MLSLWAGGYIKVASTTTAIKHVSLRRLEDDKMQTISDVTDHGLVSDQPSKLLRASVSRSVCLVRTLLTDKPRPMHTKITGHVYATPDKIISQFFAPSTD